MREPTRLACISVFGDVLEAFVSHARTEYPLEACGFFIGHGATVERFQRARNALQSPTAYEVEAAELFTLIRSLRASGEDLVAICHSHPAGPPHPSPRDIAESHYPECAYVIVSLEDSARPETRAFRIIAGKADEIELRVIV